MGKWRDYGYETDYLLRSPNGYYAIDIHERSDEFYEFYAKGGGYGIKLVLIKTI